MKAVKIHTGKGSVKRTEPLNKPGGTQRPNIGNKGNIKGSAEGQGGGSWSHLPGSNSRPNADMGKNHSPKPSPGKRGPHWSHLPEHPEVGGH